MPVCKLAGTDLKIGKCLLHLHTHKAKYFVHPSGSEKVISGAYSFLFNHFIHCLNIYFTEKYPQLMELFHSLDIWHKAKKLTKALHQVCNDVRINTSHIVGPELVGRMKAKQIHLIAAM